MHFLLMLSSRKKKCEMNILLSCTHHPLQTCMSFFLVLNTNQDILKNVGKLTVDGSH